MCLHTCAPLAPRLWNVWLGVVRRLTPPFVLYVPRLSLTEPSANSSMDAISAAIPLILASTSPARPPVLSAFIMPPYGK